MPDFRRLLLFSAISVLTNSLAARLEFEQTTLPLRSDAGGEDLLRAEFKFANRSAGPVKIVEVHPECGCTTATLAKSSYETGESGAIAVRFHVGTLVGHAVKTISIVTDEPDNNRYTLALEVDIVEWFTISPRLLFWKPNEDPAPKQLVITLANEKVRVAGIESGDKNFKAEPREGGVPDKTVITVTPLTREAGASGNLTVDFLTNDGRKIQRKIFLRILPSGAMPAPF